MDKVSKYFFYLTLFLSINLYSQECDVICELEKLKSKKIDSQLTLKESSTIQSLNDYYQDLNRPLIKDKENTSALETIYNSRKKVYNQATFSVNCNKLDKVKILDQICELYEKSNS